MKINMGYAVIYERTATGYRCYAPDLSGCVASGSSLEITRDRMQKAILWHIQGLRKQGLRVPRPRTRAEEIEVAAQTTAK